MRRLFFMVLALGLSFAAAAQQYGDNPPPGVKATPLRAPAGPSSGAASGGKPMSASQQEEAFRQRQEDAAKAADKADEKARAAADKKDNCERSQEYLRTLESGQRISRTDANGERVFMEDDQRAAETTKARAMVKQNCG